MRDYEFQHIDGHLAVVFYSDDREKYLAFEVGNVPIEEIRKWFKKAKDRAEDIVSALERES